MRTTTLNPSRLIFFVLMGIALLTLGVVLLVKANPGTIGWDEFPVNYAAAKNWVTQNISPYDLSSKDQTNQEQNGAAKDTKGESPSYFRYPLLAALVISPFTVLPMDQARAAWMVFSIVCLVTGSLLIVAFKGQKPGVWIVTAIGIFGTLNIYSLTAIVTGSLLPQVFLIAMMTLILLKDHQDVIAGFLNTIILLIPPYGLLLVIFINIWAIKEKRKKYLNGFWAGLIFELAIATIIEPNWWRGWLVSILAEIQVDGQYSSFLSQVIGYFHIDGIWLNIILHIVLLLMLWGVATPQKLKDSDGFAWLFCFFMLVTSLVAFPFLPGAQLFCMPALIFVICTWMSRSASHGKALFWSWFVILFVLPWIMSQVTNGMNFVYLQGGLYAIIGIIGLQWIRWWMSRPKY